MTQPVDSPLSNDDCLHFPPVLIMLSLYSLTQQQIISNLSDIQNKVFTARSCALIGQKVVINSL